MPDCLELQILLDESAFEEGTNVVRPFLLTWEIPGSGLRFFDSGVGARRGAGVQSPPNIMARRPRLEVEGGLYHLIVRGNNRQNIFHSPDDHNKFLSLLGAGKRQLRFYIYAYCLMTNHVHLLIERQAETVGRIMHRVLTGYSQYYNRKYQKVGHVFQGRHKAVLCQTDRYLGELVRYIHLNPVRAGMVGRAEDHPHSSHRAYLGAEPAGIVDVDSVLRLFGAEKKKARENFAQFVAAGLKLGQGAEFYTADETGILGTEEFVDATIHRLGDTGRRTRRPAEPETSDLEPGALITAVETICQVPKEDLCGPGKSKRTIWAKEALIAAGREAGASLSELGGLTGLSSSTLSKRQDAALRRSREDEDFRRLRREIVALYVRLKIEESKA